MMCQNNSEKERSATPRSVNAKPKQVTGWTSAGCRETGIKHEVKEESIVDEWKPTPQISVPLTEQQITFLIKAVNYLDRNEADHLERVTGWTYHEILKHLADYRA